VIDSASPFAGLMVKGADGPVFVTFNFAGRFSGIPVADRPTLIVNYHAGEDGPPIPERGTLRLLGAWLAALALRRRRPS
jgi:hypothetical protein